MSVVAGCVQVREPLGLLPLAGLKDEAGLTIPKPPKTSAGAAAPAGASPPLSTFVCCLNYASKQGFFLYQSSGEKAVVARRRGLPHAWRTPPWPQCMLCSPISQSGEGC